MCMCNPLVPRFQRGCVRGYGSPPDTTGPVSKSVHRQCAAHFKQCRDLEDLGSNIPRAGGNGGTEPPIHAEAARCRRVKCSFSSKRVPQGGVQGGKVVGEDADKIAQSEQPNRGSWQLSEVCLVCHGRPLQEVFEGASLCHPRE